MASPILPNSPLVEVVCELRFPGDLALLGAWGAIQAELRDEYPSLFVPAAVAGTAPMLQPLQLAREDHKRKVMLAINSFAVSTHQYEGFDAFVQTFQRAYDVLARHCVVPRFTRMGLRYTNVLPHDFGDADAAAGSLHPCLKLRLTGWSPSPSASEAPQLVYVAQRSSLDLRLSLLAAPEHAGTKLDLDCSETGDATPERMPAFLTAAHAFIEETFLSLITDEYHRYLEGRE